MKRTRLERGIYEDEKGRLWARPWANGKSTWRLLPSKTIKYAREESQAIRREIDRTKIGLGEPRKLTVAYLIAEYIKNDCPNRKLEPQREKYVTRQKQSLEGCIKTHFGERDPNSVRLKDCGLYWKFRKENLKRGKGDRIVEIELTSLSNVLNYAVAAELIELNWIANNRPSFCDDSTIQHCRDVAPESGDELNRLAAEFFACPQSEVLGWQMLMEAMTGCRTNEILKFRMDAANTNTAGYIEGNYIFVQRSKRGVNPFAMIHPDLAEVINAHHHWHRNRFPDSPWWFPGNGTVTAVGVTALVHGLSRITRNLGLPHRTSHGMRSFYVTMRRSQGATDVQVAAEIGDKSVDLIPRTYGNLPPNWTGRKGLSWRPTEGDPAWAEWMGEGVILMPTQAAG
jgi:integrase